MLGVTLDTNTVDPEKRQAIEQAVPRGDVELRVTTVTERGLEGTDLELRDPSVPETMVLAVSDDSCGTP